MSRQLPSFDLIVATVSRTEELRRFLDSVEEQGSIHVRLLVADQNDDERLEQMLRGRSIRVEHVRARRGLSHARNAVLPLVEADIVAFPDDDCVYPPALLSTLGERFANDPTLDGIAGRTEDLHGASSGSWETDRALLTSDNLWNRANAATIFLRRELVARIGAFDERLGLGSGEPWSSGEETDYLIRAIQVGARIEYDPSLTVMHDVRVDDERIGLRDGASLGYLLRKHRYPPRILARMFTRPLGGAVLALVRRDMPRARYYAASLRGRIRGYFGANRSKSSA